MGLCFRKDEQCRNKHERDVLPLDDQTMMHLAEQPSFCCALCDIEMQNVEEAEKHALSTEHTEALSKVHDDKWMCKFCCITFPPFSRHRQQWLHHFIEKGRYWKSDSLEKTCVLCDCTFNKSVMKFHLQSPQHEGFLKSSFMHCQICNTFFLNDESYNRHLQGKKHASMLTPREPKDKVEAATFTCESCPGIVMRYEKQYQAHLEGKKHKKNVQKASMVMWTCEYCEITIDKSQSLAHLETKKHKKKANTTGTVQIKVESSDDKTAVIECNLCSSKLNIQNAGLHFAGSQHRKNVNKIENQLLCDVCQMPHNSPASYNSHINSKKHKKNIISSKRDQFDRTRRCVTCDQVFTDEMLYGEHLISSIHKAM